MKCTRTNVATRGTKIGSYLISVEVFDDLCLHYWYTVNVFVVVLHNITLHCVFLRESLTLKFNWLFRKWNAFNGIKINYICNFKKSTFVPFIWSICAKVEEGFGRTIRGQIQYVVAYPAFVIPVACRSYIGHLVHPEVVAPQRGLYFMISSRWSAGW